MSRSSWAAGMKLFREPRRWARSPARCRRSTTVSTGMGERKIRAREMREGEGREKEDGSGVRKKRAKSGGVREAQL